MAILKAITSNIIPKPEDVFSTLGGTYSLKTIARMRMALPYMLSGINQGMSFVAVERLLKPMNATFRRTDMLKMYRQLGAVTEKRPGMSMGKRLDFIPDDLYVQGGVWQISKYRYLVSSTIVNIETGEEEYVYTNISSKSRLGRFKIYDKTREYLEESYSRYNKMIKEHKVMTAFYTDSPYPKRTTRKAK